MIADLLKVLISVDLLGSFFSSMGIQALSGTKFKKHCMATMTARGRIRHRRDVYMVSILLALE